MSPRELVSVTRAALFETDGYLPRWPTPAALIFAVVLCLPHARFKWIDSKVCDALDVWDES